MKKIIALIVLLAVPVMAEINFNKIVIGKWSTSESGYFGIMEFTDTQVAWTTEESDLFPERTLLFDYSITDGVITFTNDTVYMTFKIKQFNKETLFLTGNDPDSKHRTIKLEKILERKKRK